MELSRRFVDLTTAMVLSPSVYLEMATTVGFHTRSHILVQPSSPLLFRSKVLFLLVQNQYCIQYIKSYSLSKKVYAVMSSFTCFLLLLEISNTFSKKKPEINNFFIFISKKKKSFFKFIFLKLKLHAISTVIHFCFQDLIL